MADEAQDELVFTMVAGDPVRKYVAAGSGKQELADSFGDEWVEIDDTTRIRTDKIVSVRLVTDSYVPLTG